MTTPPVRLLLLEDTRTDAELLQAALDEFAPGGFAVTHVERLADALARIGTGQFDVLLCDLGLPDSTGPATVQAIAARAPALPLVVLTGMKDEDLGRAVIEHGAQDYLVKGESGGALTVRTLRYAIERKRLEIGLRAANEALAGRVAERTAELDAANAILLANAAGYRKLFDANPLPMYMCDPETLRFLAVNDAAVAHYGWSRDEFLAMTLADIRPAGEIQRLRDHIARVQREDIAEAGYWRHRKKDGTRIDVEITSHAIEFGGRRARVVLAHDITERMRAEEALRESEARFRSLTEMSSDFYWETDVEHRFTEGNTAAELGVRSVWRVQIGKRRWETPSLSPDEAGWQAHRAVLEAHQPFREFELSRLGADGAEHYLSLSGDPVFDASGAFRGYRGVGSDITGRKRAEKALHESEARFRSLTEMSSDFYWETDVEHRFTVHSSSSKLSQVWASQLGTQIGKRRWEVPYLSPDEGGWQAHRAMLDAHRPFRDFVFSRRGLDDAARHFTVSGDPMFDASGAFKGYRGVGSDITGREKAEQALRAAEAQFRSLVEQSIAGTYIIQDGKFAYVNKRFAEIFGYESADELIGVEALSVVAGKDRGVVLDMRRKIEGGAPSMSYDFGALRKDGSTIHVGVHSAHAIHQGRPAIIGLMQDISEKKRAEEEILRYVAQLETAFMSTVGVATTLSEMRDPYRAGHERRVAEIAAAIGAELAFDERRIEGLRVAGSLHDIGTIAIPAEILSKPGKLSAIELRLIQGHPQASYDVLKAVEFPWPVAEVALQHHERVDGSGYPQGLKGEAILLEARIMAVADVIEAMSSHRPYRAGLGIEAALAEIERGRGTAYDDVVAEACLKLFREKGYAVPA